MKTQRQTQAQTPRAVTQAKVRGVPGIDPGFALLIAVVAVLLALALGTAIFALVPITV